MFYHRQVPRTQRLDASNPTHIARAAELLRTGHTVAFPTETVYGLGANALDPQALAKIFAAKQRPTWDPLIVHIAARTQLPHIATSNPTAEALMSKFWPGPLTLLLPRTPAIPDLVTAGRPLVGVRIPAHPVALALLTQAAIPIAAPSANTFSHTSPTTAAHVLADLDGRIDAILDGGPTQVGLESTVAEITLSQSEKLRITVYRPGAITLEMLAAYAPTNVHQPLALEQPPQSLPAPGVGLRHYAPQAHLLLVEPTNFRFASLEAQLFEALAEALAASHPVGVMLPDSWLPDLWLRRLANAEPYLFPWGPWENPALLAQRLFAGLRALDEVGVKLILCPVPAGDGVAQAIRDRLHKAARPV